MPQIQVQALLTMPEAVIEWITARPIPPLASGKIDENACRSVSVLVDRLVDSLQPTEPSTARKLSTAGLYLLANDLDQSHEISQNLDSPSGSYWHGVMHRREGDFWNAKYWFRQFKRHAVDAALPLLVRQIVPEAADLFLQANSAQPLWDHAAFVDACERAAAISTSHRLSKMTTKSVSDSDIDLESLKLIAWLEWQLLFADGLR